MSTTAAASTSQVVTLPHIPELFDSDFLDVLLPPRSLPDTHHLAAAPVPKNAFMDALKSVAHHKLTQNGAPAFSSTLSGYAGRVSRAVACRPARLLQKYTLCFPRRGRKTPPSHLRIVWNTRSIHDGKGDTELFYRCFGWLYEHHPRTAIANLSQLVAPVCTIKSKRTKMPHGYWKDLLNILALSTLGELDAHPAPFLHTPRGPFHRRRSLGPTKMMAAERSAAATPEETHALLTAKNQKAKAAARDRRVKLAADGHTLLLAKLNSPSPASAPSTSP